MSENESVQEQGQEPLIEGEGSEELHRLGPWGLWSLDFLEGMLHPSKEAAAIERFKKIGESFHKLSAGKVALTYVDLAIETDEHLLIDGPDQKLLFLEDTLGFIKWSDSFLDRREEVKLLKKRSAAILLFHKMALRLERAFAIGLTIRPDVPAEAIHAFAMLMREPTNPDPRLELQRLTEEMKKRNITGIEFISKDELIPGTGMHATIRVLLTMMAHSANGLPDTELKGWAERYQGIAGTQVAKEVFTNVVQDVVANLHRIAQGPRLEAMQAAFLKAMEPPHLVAWRRKLEEQGSELAAQLVKETDPGSRSDIEGQLKSLSRLLDKVTLQIPPELLAEMQAERAGKVDEKRFSALQQIAAPLIADAIGYLKRMSTEREQSYYKRSVGQCVEAFPLLVAGHVPVARLVLQAIGAHLRPVPEVPWRVELAAAALKDLATEAHVNRLLELIASPDKPENRDHARAALTYLGAAGLPLLAKRFEKAPADEAGQAQLAAIAGLLRDMAPVAEPFLAERLAAPEAPAALLKAALEVVGTVRKPERFDLVAKFAGHADHGVREAALRALAHIDPLKGQALIKRSIGDRDFNIARAAILLMGELKTQDANVIQQFLDTIKRRPKDVPDLDDKLQIVTIQALGMLGNVNLRSGGTLEDYLLDVLGGPEKKGMLGLGGGKLREKSTPVRSAICETLGLLGGEKTLAAMRQLALSDPNEPVKAKARDAVKTINTRGGRAG